MHKMVVWCTLYLSLVVVVYSYPWFQLEIPNGDRVPHPCWLDNIRDGVGHKNMKGGGDRNPFGVAFMKSGFRWTKALCEADTDGDGETNGAELGDPSCVWTKGNTPAQPALSHPGICEDVESANCKMRNNWNICDQKVFNCASIKETGVTTLELKFPKTPVPSTETNYYCMLFELPADKDYHIIAHQPIIDSRYIIHHMMLYACPHGTNVTELKKAYQTPTPCRKLAQSTCGSTIGGWTVGGVGDCFDDIDAGIRIGKTAYRYVILQVHWNNPDLRTGWEDGSGMKLYLTEFLRTHDLGVLTVGQMGLRIPPNNKAYKQESTCSSECTKEQLGNTSIYVVSAGLHMRYIGSKAYLDLYRDNRHIASLAADEHYEYNSPVDHNHDPAIEVRPGDELHTRCIFDTSNRKKHVYYGLATSDEMCFSYITYYPKTDFSYCVQVGTTELCNEFEKEFIGTCKTTELRGYYSDYVVDELGAVYSYCDNTGLKCYSGCRKLLTEEPIDSCLTDDVRRYVEIGLAREGSGQAYLLLAIRSCDEKVHVESLESGVSTVVYETRSVLDLESGVSTVVYETRSVLVLESGVSSVVYEARSVLVVLGFILGGLSQRVLTL